jgi:hypothetical protein
MGWRRSKHNKPLVPTRNGEAPLLAAQRRRYACSRDRSDAVEGTVL